jgi:hypothetical protein
MRALNVTSLIAQNISGRRSAVDARTTRHPAMRCASRSESASRKPFGWRKTIGGLARPMLRGVKRFHFKFPLAMPTYNPISLPKLIRATP